ncbi:MAG: tryptophan synthase subunit alpha [Pyrinomonadaceae bacterium]
MNRIARVFKNLQANDSGGFIPFVSAGDPDLETSREIVKMLAKNGADIIELGVPFSDPMADGPTIQASSQRALDQGVTLTDVLAMVRDIRTETDVPIVLFSYLNPLFRYGIERLADDAASAGADGVLVTDAVDEDAAAIASVLRDRDLDLISLVAPTTSDDRLKRIAENASRFIYAVSRAGVTGARDETSTAAEALVARIRKFSDLPVAVGFGISTREQIEDVWRYADAAVVGSAIVAEIERSKGRADVVDQVRSFVASLLPEVAKDAVET